MKATDAVAAVLLFPLMLITGGVAGLIAALFMVMAATLVAMQA